MDIAWARDLVICIYGSVISILLIIIAVLLFILYRKLRAVLKGLEAMSAVLHTITSELEREVVRPVLQIASFAYGLRNTINSINILKKRKSDKEV